MVALNLMTLTRQSGNPENTKNIVLVFRNAPIPLP
jgi:hypothetical protein